LGDLRGRKKGSSGGQGVKVPLLKESPIASANIF
jgi:hypothetical protein